MATLGIITIVFGVVVLVLVAISVALFFRGDYDIKSIGSLYGDFPRFFTMVFFSIVVLAGLFAFSFCDYTEIDGTWQVVLYEKMEYVLVANQADLHAQDSENAFSLISSQSSSFLVYTLDEQTGETRMVTLPASDTTIYFSDGVPRYERITEAFTCEGKNHFGIRKTIKLPIKTIYNLFVPEGSLASYDFD